MIMSTLALGACVLGLLVSLASWGSEALEALRRQRRIHLLCR